MLQVMGSQRLRHNLVTGQQIKGLHIPLGDLVSSPLGSSESYHEKLQIICHVSQYLFKLTQFREFGVQIGNFSQNIILILPWKIRKEEQVSVLFCFL